jgi:hypothetical protein
MGFVCRDCLNDSLKADFGKIAKNDMKISLLEERVNELTSLKFKMHQSIYDKITEGKKNE